jgi:hypothetical protein
MKQNRSGYLEKKEMREHCGGHLAKKENCEPILTRARFHEIESAQSS